MKKQSDTLMTDHQKIRINEPIGMVPRAKRLEVTRNNEPSSDISYFAESCFYSESINHRKQITLLKNLPDQSNISNEPLMTTKLNS
jgi:hypothetical protein